MATVCPPHQNNSSPQTKNSSMPLLFRLGVWRLKNHATCPRSQGQKRQGQGSNRCPDSKALRITSALPGCDAPALLAPPRPPSQACVWASAPGPTASRRAPRTLTSGGPRSGCCGRTCRGPRPPSSASGQTCPQPSPVARLTVSYPIRPAARRPRQHLKPSR